MRKFTFVSIALAFVAAGLLALVSKPVPKSLADPTLMFVYSTLKPHNPNRPELYRTVTVGTKSGKEAIRGSIPVRTTSFRPMPEENEELVGDLISEEEVKDVSNDFVKIVRGVRN